jgi:UDP-N-acetylmuramoyl-L-alanyl-D-glutamate--2,6-diaminopimelate ligase
MDLIKEIPLSVSPSGPWNLDITGLTEDSRAVSQGMLFAALQGSNANGLSYVADALRRGASAVLVPEDAKLDPLPAIVLRADNPRRALALLAARYYGSQPATVAAVTGTNGKTSVASFLRQIWASMGHDAASLGTIGIVTKRQETPLAHTTPGPVEIHRRISALAAEGVTHLALEASSHGLDQFRLDGMRLAAGAFTNITRDHLDYHATFEDYHNAKLRLFRDLLPAGAPAVVDADGAGATSFIETARRRDLDLLTVGRRGDAIRLEDAERSGFKQILRLDIGGKRRTVELPLAGDFQVANALVAAGLAIGLGDDVDRVTDALSALQGAKGRLEYAGETAMGAPVFIDYAHTPDALAKALQALRPYATGRLHVVFGCGGDRDTGKRPEMGRAAVLNADVVTVTDDNPRGEDPAAIRAAILAASPGAAEIEGRAKAIRDAIGTLSAGDVLLVAGKGHETGQIVGKTVIPYSDHEAVAEALAAGLEMRRAADG